MGDRSKKRKKCKACNSQRVAQLNKQLLNGNSLNGLSKQYGMSRDVIRRHKNECLSELLQEAFEEKGLIRDSLIKQVETDISMIHKLIKACDAWLTDPNDPTKYFLGPRGEEIDIVYQEIDEKTGRQLPTMRKASLQEMIHTVERGGYLVRNINLKYADPRELLLKSISKLEGIVKMILETTQNEIENKHKRAAIDKAASEGSMISIEKQISQITERVTIAMKSSNTAELCKMAGLPEL